MKENPEYLVKDEVSVENKSSIIDILPEKENGSLPVLFAPGWSDMPSSTEKPLKKLSQKGYRVLSLTHERERDDDIESVEMQKAISLLNVLENKGIKKVDAVGYSEAGINLCMAVLLNPEKFRNIILFNPTGMSGKTSLFRHFLRYFQDLGSTLTHTQNLEGLGDISSSLIKQQGYILKNPILAMKEVAEITETDISEMLEEIKKLGIKIIIISSAGDRLLPMEDIQDNEKLKGGKHKNIIDGFYSIRGTHHNLITDPDDSVTVIDRALRATQAQKEKN